MSRLVLPDADLRQILLARAVEESASSELDERARRAAALASLSAGDDGEVLTLRARHLCRELPMGTRAWLRAGLLPDAAVWAIFAVCVLVGLSANYLGGDGQFHIVYNPVSLLLMWNLLAYGLLAFGRIRPAQRVSMPAPAAPPEVEAAELSHAPPAPWWLRRMLPGLWQRYLRLRYQLHHSREQARRWSALGQQYLRYYAEAAAAALRGQLRMLMHLSALGLTLGALIGLYVQGLFTEYHALWRSTFIEDPDTVRTLVTILLGPAAMLLDGAWPSLDDVRQLASPAGAPASRWLHKLALMALMVVILPRGVLFVRARQRFLADSQVMELDLGDSYFRHTLLHTREDHVKRIREGMAAEIQAEIEQLSADLAGTVRIELFQGRILPLLRAFRDSGGKLADLEADIASATRAFEPILARQVDRRQLAFSQALQGRLYALIGREFPDLELPLLGDRTSASARQIGARLGDGVAADVGGAIGVAVTTTVSAAIGSLSGGIGHSIGIAVISHLFGTTGPVGLMIGAGLGLAGGAAIYVMGKDRLRARLKTWRTPAPLARMALRERKLDAAGEQIARAVEDQIQGELAPMIDAITDALLARLPRELPETRHSHHGTHQ